ncbi:unnamed protein product, partial [Choristocarpus tenellus]
VTKETRIALVGKYTENHDTYLSVVKALLHASLACNFKLKIEWIDSCALEASQIQQDPERHALAWKTLRSSHGVLVPGGFGLRGLEGMIEAVKYARYGGVPYLGICLGMQAAVIEFARSKLVRPKSNSAEFVKGLKEGEEVVVFMPEGDRQRMGGTMRLGSRTTLLQPGSMAHRLYGGEGEEELEV